MSFVYNKMTKLKYRDRQTHTNTQIKIQTPQNRKR